MPATVSYDDAAQSPARARPNVAARARPPERSVQRGGERAAAAPVRRLHAASGARRGGDLCVRQASRNLRAAGDLTVAGICLCNGRVTMSGESYELEFLGGKCVPKRCPDKSYLKDGNALPATTPLWLHLPTGLHPR